MSRQGVLQIVDSLALAGPEQFLALLAAHHVAEVRQT
jgi:hypothetical protein